MIVAAHAKEALRAALDDPSDAAHGFHHVDFDTDWNPKLFMFLDSSQVESTADYDTDPNGRADYCGTVLRELPETSRFYLYACSIAGDDNPTPLDVELQVNRFTATVLAHIASDITLGLNLPGVRAIRTAVLSTETSRRQMQAGAGGQLFNACRVVLEIEVAAHITPAELATT